MDKNYKIPGELLERLGKYLITKPYVEVFQLIDELKVLTPVEDTSDNQPLTLPQNDIVNIPTSEIRKRMIRN